MRMIKATLVLLVVVALSSSCLVARVVSIETKFDIPNTITDRGFLYVKKGVEHRYQVDGIFPAKLDRAKLLPQLNVAQNAYGHLWRAAGGLKDNQRFVNVMIEASFVQVVGFSAKLFLVVHMYADVIQFQAAAAPAPASPSPSGKAAPKSHPGSAKLIRLIDRSIARAAARHLPEG